MTGPQFAAQVAAVVSLVEASANHCKAAAVAKEAMAIKYGNTTGHSITKFLESPFAGKPRAARRHLRRHLRTHVGAISGVGIV